MSDDNSTVRYVGGPWDGVASTMPKSWVTEDIYPMTTTGIGKNTGFYFNFYFKYGGKDWKWVPFEFGHGSLEDKLNELRGT